jgi:hypothetical protein
MQGAEITLRVIESKDLETSRELLRTALQFSGLALIPAGYP